MVDVYIVILFLFTHWIGDFVLQTDYMALNKATDVKALLTHILSYLIVWFIVGVFIFDDEKLLYFLLITFVSHFITDYITSKLNKILRKENKIHLFFISLGFDQLLHFIQIFITYDYLNNL